ncbi:MAG: O-antigen ligase family protein [Opitutae bacterium]|nr:O-antigen ligase family protein [Opitutae bacterium]
MTDPESGRNSGQSTSSRHSRGRSHNSAHHRSWWERHAENSRERHILAREQAEAQAKIFGVARPVSLRQKMITAAACITIVWTTWALAGQTPFTLSVSVIFSLLTFLLLFIPNGEIGNVAGIRQKVHDIVRFPPFWLGLLLLIYMVVQAQNPAVLVDLGEKSWRLHTLPDAIPWLPTGVDAPFSVGAGGMNAWRQICVFGSAWLLLCALWCGLHSRLMWEILLCVFLANAVILGGLGLYRISTGTTHLFDYSRLTFFSTFSYRNQGGAFFVLAISVCVALGLRYWRAAVQRGLRGGAYLLMLICGLILLGVVFATKSVASVFLGVLWLPLSLLLIIASRLLTRASFIAIGIFAALLLALAGTWWCTVDTEAFFARVDSKAKVGELPTVENTIGVELATDLDADNPDEDYENEPVERFSLDKGGRAELRRLSWKMFHQNRHMETFGWGAGSYRWIAPVFQKTMPEFLKTNRRGETYLPYKTEYAHCDPLQMLVEWGVVGAGIFFVGVAGFVLFAIRNFRRWRVSSVALLLGLAIFCAHSCVDFLTYNPALLLCVATVASAFHADLRRDKPATTIPPEKNNG